MISEFAYLQIEPDNAAAFEEAVSKARPHFQNAKGCFGMRLCRVLETAGHYVLQVDWESVEAHMVDFRESEDFEQWRQLVGGFFIAPPRVEHVQTTDLF